jgi:hypothetical protein
MITQKEIEPAPDHLTPEERTQYYRGTRKIPRWTINGEKEEYYTRSLTEYFCPTCKTKESSVQVADRVVEEFPKLFKGA